MGKKQKDTTPAAQPDARRHTIGYTGSQLTNRNNYTVWQGVIDAAREQDVNVISLFPEDLDTTNGFDAQANVLFDLINPDLLDGLVIWASNLSNYAGPEGAKRIFEYYRSVPIVSIEKGGSKDIPYLEIDSYQSMREAVIHLIRDHGHRRIAFIRGPDATHAGARERYQGYLDVLSEYGIPFDPDLVSPPTEGSWKQEVGEEAISLFFDQRHTSFDAVIGVCDHIAIGAMRALDARGIHIPGQVAVVGFDDDTGSNSTIPPLTTMSLRGYEQGRQAAQTLLKRLDGGQIPAQAKVPPQLVIRQSCGCINPAVTQAAAGSAIVTDKPLEAFTANRREKALSEMKQAAGTAAEGLDPGWADELLATFFTELKAGKPGAFLSALDEVLRQVIATEGQVESWANVISALRRCALPYLENSQLLLRAEDLWLQSQVMVGETAQQAQRHQAAQLEKQTQILNEIRAALITTFDMNALMDTLARELPRLGIPSCYLSLYENPKQPTGQSRLVLAYDTRRGRLNLEAENPVFPSPRLAPDGMLPQDRRYSLVTEALYFRDEQLGFVIFEVGPREGPIYGMLREEISSALQGAQLVRRVQERSAELMRQQYILDTFMENIPDRIYFKDVQSRMTRVNKAYAIRAGVQDFSELIGKSDFDFFPLDQAEIKYQQEQEIIKTGQPILGLEEPDGIDHWALATKMPLRDETGAIIGTFGISSDITELVKAKQAVESRAHELEQAYETLQKQQQVLLVTEKMALLGRLTAGIAHEMNTPLAAVRAALANVEGLVKEYQASIGDASVTDTDHYEIARELHSAVQLAEKAAERAAGFVRGIKSQTLGLAAQESQPINAVAAVEDALLLLNHALRQGKCELDFKKSHNEIQVVGTPGRLEQVVTNLVNNAIDASYPQGGLITVSLNKHSEFVELQVSDHGSGIPPENLSKIFDPMFSSKPFGSSTGLGLTIVHDIVVGEFGGSIDVTSKLGQGTTFIIHLPLKE